MDIETFREFALFEGMTDDELARNAQLFEPIRRMAGERVTKEDDFGYSLFLVISGRLSVDSHGDVVAELAAGDCFGEVSLVTGEKRNATVTALETCELQDHDLGLRCAHRGISRSRRAHQGNRRSAPE